MSREGNRMSLESSSGPERLGWSSFFEQQWQQHHGHTADGSAFFPARVVGEERGLARLATDLACEFWGELTGKARLDEHPAVGDWVVASRASLGARAQIHAVLPRRTCLTRRAAGRSDRPQILAANVDVAFLVASLHLDFHARRLERYLTTVWDGGARPIVLLTKLDLCDDPAPFVREVEAVAPGVEVHALSGLTGDGVDAVASSLPPGTTAVLLGSSGTGKSTLINRLLGQDVAPTLPIRKHDGRGRHATTSRHLWALASGGLVIDTPGMRELQLWVDEETLGRVFGDVGDVARRCRFRDCGHGSEPGCAVRAALADGSLPEERFASYVKLGRELAFQARKSDRAEMSREKERWKRIHRDARARDKHRRM